MSAQPRRRRWRRVFAGLLLFVLLLGVAGYLARSVVLPPVARFLDVSEPPHKVDYVMVLGGGSEIRPFVAAALLRAGFAEQALIPTVAAPPNVEYRRTEHELIRRVLLKRGIAESRIVQLPGTCRSTFEEAQALADFLDDHPNASVAVITHTVHTRRARLVFQKVLGERAGNVSFVAAPTQHFNETNWWRCHDGMEFVANEYAKLAYYLIRY